MLNPTNRTGLSTHISVTTHTKPKRTGEKGKKAPSLCIFPSYRHTSTQRPQAQTLSYQNKRRYLFCPLAIFMPFFFINNRVCLWELKPKLTHKQKVRHFIFVHIGPSFLTHHSSTVSLSSFVGWWAASFYEYTT